MSRFKREFLAISLSGEMVLRKALKSKGDLIDKGYLAKEAKTVLTLYFLHNFKFCSILPIALALSKEDKLIKFENEIPIAVFLANLQKI